MLKLVKTENGYVKGLQGNNARISVFKGIPFAAPPLGENRWKAPLPCEDWDGVYIADEFAPISMQDTPGISGDVYCKEWHVDPDIPMDEDCLYLNVWTNAKKTDEKLPVLVWFFGGAYQWGYTAEMEFNGENIAKRGVVVVSIGYRLGAFGFLAHKDLSNENNGTTNFGLLDQLAGLQWVQKNIAAFGGDPDNVTIAGQSAGGASVLAHMTSPMSAGYFNKAIIFSGLIRSPYFVDKLITPYPVADMEKLGDDFLRFLGVSSIVEARKLDATFIRNKYGEFAEANPRFCPCIDQHFIVDDPYKLMISGKHANVPLLCGNTFDEFIAGIYAKDEAELSNQAKKLFDTDTDTFLSFKESKEHLDGFYAPCRMIEVSTKAVLNSYANDAYYYVFDTIIPGDDHPGTFHSVDLWFFFETLSGSPRPFAGTHYELARQMCGYISNFIKTGNPNGTDLTYGQLPKWEPYTSTCKNEMHFSKDGCVPSILNSNYYDFLCEQLAKNNQLATGNQLASDNQLSNNNQTAINSPLTTDNQAAISNQLASDSQKKIKQAFNPYLPSYEYIPDGEPYVFDGRVYVYGSHDAFRGHAFCLNDYVCYSAPVDDLSDWRYEGVIYTRLDDPLNKEHNKMCLYAPDVTKGPDGRYYLFYVLDKISIVSVAVCDTPAGRYEFYGYVHYADGTRLGDREGDEPQFDPGVITVGDKTYLYTGFCGHGDKSRSGAMVTVLDKDMLTVIENPKIILPGACYADGTQFEGHAFFEASSIRYFDDTYYFIYSSQVMHELCYATSKNPLGPFTYGGVIVSNADMHIDTYKKADMPTAYGGNNHGSLIEIDGKRYIFYHRQTLNCWYSRQGCAEEVTFNADGSINQAEITSCGLNQGPLLDTECYPSYIACNLFTRESETYVGGHHVPFITQEGRDGDANIGFVDQITDGTTIGFKYFDCKNVTGIHIAVRGYANGHFEVRTAIDGAVLAQLPVEFSTVWESHEAACNIPDGVNALYFTFVGDGTCQFKEFMMLH